MAPPPKRPPLSSFLRIANPAGKTPLTPAERNSITQGYDKTYGTHIFQGGVLPSPLVQAAAAKKSPKRAPMAPGGRK